MKQASRTQLIVGLGNPGPQYKKTRHNVGFWFLQNLATKYNGLFKKETKFKGLFCDIDIDGHECKLLMPQTYMNLSGEAVQKVVHFYKIPIQNILIVHDELDFPTGVIRLKSGGSSNKHNGLQNIIDNLNSNMFWRLRIGIDKPADKIDTTHYVVSAPKKGDRIQIETALLAAIDIAPLLVAGETAKAVEYLHSTV